MRVYNFSAGPSMLPLPVLERAAKEMTDYEGSGMSVMEMSHRSKVYQSIIDDAQARLRSVMAIPDDYEVLFMQGGASQQFACVPLNLLKTKPKQRVAAHAVLAVRSLQPLQTRRNRLLNTLAMTICFLISTSFG